MSVDMKTVLFKSLGDHTRERIDVWITTTQANLKLCHQLGAITGLWTHGPTIAAFICMSGTTKNKLNNAQQNFDAAWEARRGNHMCLAKHMMINDYVDGTDT